MPQASEEDRKAWGGECGVGDDKAIGHLEACGYVLTRRWQWRKPTPAHVPSVDELDAMCFLIDEWDFDGVEPDEP